MHHDSLWLISFSTVLFIDELHDYIRCDVCPSVTEIGYSYWSHTPYILKWQASKTPANTVV